MERGPRHEEQLTPGDDLCPLCRNRRHCVYCHRERAPVEECPGFLLAPGFHTLQLQRAEGLGAIGLCRSCARGESCERERPVGGVWHCEDYC